jgi:ABC-type branched-subunit amino acid transport system substrate-binding protein
MDSSMQPSVEPWTLGVLFSITGHMAIPSQQHVRGVELAVDEVNAAGGVLGRPLETRRYDTRSDLGLYRRYIDQLLTEDAVNTVIGCCTSLSRKVVLPSIERRNGLLLYPDLYEGFEYSPNVLYVGAATNQNTLPLARYLLRSGARSYVLLGSDYIYPREANRVMRDLIERQGGRVLDELYAPIGAGAEQIESLVQRLAALKPDIVFNTLVGQSICHLLAAFAALGIDDRIAIASHNVTEAEMLSMSTPPVAGHVTSAPYFSSLATAPNRRFVHAFRGRFGAGAPVSQYAAAAYSAVHLFAIALARAGEMDTQRIMQCVRGLQMEAPQGSIVVDDDNNHTWMTPRVGRWNGRDGFDVVWEAREPAQPDPWLVNYGGVDTLVASDAEQPA